MELTDRLALIDVSATVLDGTARSPMQTVPRIEVCPGVRVCYTEPGALTAGFELYRAIDHDNKAVAASGLLAVPVLAVDGSGKWGRATETADSLRRMAENVTELVIEKAGHWVPEEQPVQLAQSLDSFFTA